MQYKNNCQKNINVAPKTLKYFVVFAFCIFLTICISLNINIFHLDKTNIYNSVALYDTYVLKRYFLFIYIVVILFLMSLFPMLLKRINTLEEIGKIALYSYSLFGVYASIKIFYILLTPQAPWIIIPGFIADIIIGLGEIHFMYFFIALGCSIYIWWGIAKLLIKFLNPIIYFILSILLLGFCIYEFIKFCLYIEEFFTAFS